MMHLGLFISGDGHHIAAWLDPDSNVHANQDPAHFANLARLGERGLFDFLFTADTNAFFFGDDIAALRQTTEALRLEPLTLLSYLAAATRHIGLICTATTTYLEPFHVARLFASLDQISRGRAGWNLVTSSAPAEARNFSQPAHPDAEARYDRAEEFVDVVLGLWNSWEDDAIAADRDAAHYFDPAKLHRLDHEGKHFSVRGPLAISRSPQGRPLIVQAGQSERGRALAARTAEVIFTVQQNIDDARAFYADIKTRAAAFGRDPDGIKIMPGFLPVIGETRAEAEAKLARIQDRIPREVGLARLSGMLGYDLTGCADDDPLPDIPPSIEQPGRQKVVLDLARRENLNVGQLYRRVTGVRGHRIFCGTAVEIADEMEAWHRAGAADGFNVMSLTYPDELEQFIETVIPILQERGLYRTEYASTHLRGNLGLPVPANRYAGAQPEAKREER